MEKLHHPPVEILITCFGGVRKFAKEVGRDPAAIVRWRKSGTVPANMQRKVLETAWERGYTITAHELIFGRAMND